ncbi:MAG: phosphatase PAP2 family protein [Acidimicrobiales bacterium]
MSVGSVIEVNPSSVDAPPTLVVVPSPAKPKRSRVSVELAWLLFLVFIYDWLQDLAPLRRSLAFVNARAVLSFETNVGLDPERALDHWLAHQHVLPFIVSTFYSNGIFVVTFAFAAVLWWSRPDLYRPLRNDLVLTNLIGFAVFWAFPVAPPRMLPGFIDVVARSGGLGSWHGSLIKHADQLAAMPSMHIGYAIWCSLVAWRLARKHSAKVAALVFGIGYPVLTAFVVMSTGNHYLLDVLGGAASAAVAVFAVEVAPRLLRRLLAGSAAGWTTPFQQPAFQQALQQLDAQRQAVPRSSIAASRPSGTPLP